MAEEIRKGGEVSSKYKPLIIGGAILFVLDMAAVITMIANPDLTARVIPALVAIQILGFIGIAAAYLSRGQKLDEAGESQGNQSRSSKEWAVWLFCGLAMIYLFRALLAIGYIAAHGWHRKQLLVPSAGIAITCYLLYLAFAVRKRMRKKNSVEKGEGEQSK